MSELFQMLQAGSTGLAVILMVVIGYLYRQREQDAKAHAAELIALNAKISDVLEKVIPLVTLIPPSVERLHEAIERLK
jgi:hypothetical protein